MKKRLPRYLRWPVRILVALAILIVGFYQLTAWSGARAWKKAVAEYEFAGGTLDFDSLLPEPIPADQNYASIAALNGVTAEVDSQPLADALSLQDVFKDGFGDYHEVKVGEKQYQLQPLTFGFAHASGAHADLRTWASELVRLSSPKGDPAPPGTADPESPADIADIAASILGTLDSHFAGVFSQSDSAASRPDARWLPLISDAYDREIPVRTFSGHFQASTDFGRILTLRALTAVHARKPAVAHASILALLHLANAENPFATGFGSILYTLSHDTQSFTATSEALAARLFDDSSLAELQRRFAKIDTFTQYASALRMDIVSTTRTLGAFNQGDFDDIDVYYSYQLRLPNFFYPSGWIDQDRASYLREMHESAIVPLEKRDVPMLQNRQAALRAWVDELRESRLAPFRYRLLICLFPSFDYLNAQVVHAQAVANQAQAACALERFFIKHGTYPDSLDSLVPEFLQEIPEDPIDRQPLRYRRTPEDDRYLLYSIGWNRKDENATPAWNPNHPDRIDFQNGDWVWSYRNLQLASTPVPVE